MTYMGIPYKENEVLSLRLFPSGSPVEYFIAFVTLVSAFGFRHFYFHQLQIPSVNEAMDEIRYIFYVLTQPHFASWLISIMPYNILSLIALVVGVWMAVFRGLHSFGMGLIVIAIALFFYGQAIT